MDHVEKYYWIIDHPKLGHEHCQSLIELTPHRLNPVNNTIEEDIILNTKYQWWVELTYQELNSVTGGMGLLP